MDTLIRNNVNVYGSGDRTMVLAHGFGCDQSMWRFLVKCFRSSYRVVVFDYVGCGKSDHGSYDGRRYATLDGYAQDLLDVMHSLDVTDAIFVGHSASAMIGAIAAAREPDLFSELVMISASPCYLNEPPHYMGGFEPEDIRALLNIMEHNYRGWIDYIAPTMMKNSDKPLLADELSNGMGAMDPYIARRFAEVTFQSDSRPLLTRITTPVLILQCRDDSLVPLEVAETLARQIRPSTLFLMDATGHCPHLSHPEETVRLIRNYLAMSLATVAFES